MTDSRIMWSNAQLVWSEGQYSLTVDHYLTERPAWYLRQRLQQRLHKVAGVVSYSLTNSTVEEAAGRTTASPGELTVSFPSPSAVNAPDLVELVDHEAVEAVRELIRDEEFDRVTAGPWRDVVRLGPKPPVVDDGSQASGTSA